MSFKSLTSSTALLFITCLIIGLFVARPLWHKYSDAKTQLASLQASNKNLQDGLSSLQNFISAYKSTSTNATVVNQALPIKSSNLNDFVSSVGQMAQASGVLLSNFSVQDENSTVTKPTPPNTIQAVVIDMSASGGFPAFKDLMLRMENYLRVVDVNHITLKADDTGSIQYQMEFKTYYQK